MHPFTKWFFFYGWNKAVWLLGLYYRAFVLSQMGRLFSPGAFEPQMPERRRDLSPHCLLKYESIIYRQLLQSKTVELYSDIAPCGGTIE